MNALVYLIPAALLLGLLGLLAFLWALKSGQCEDLDGAAHRLRWDEEEGAPPFRKGGLPCRSSQRRTVSR